MGILAPSILSADFSNLSQQIRYAEIGGADWIHCDVMDGKFVPVRKITKLPIDVHLMIEKPDSLIKDFIRAGADYITVHQEEVVHLHRTVEFIKQEGSKAGIAVNPATPVDTLSEILPFIDLVLIMSVNPGFGGQSFITTSLNKIKQLNQMRKDKDYKFLIEVDGGISSKNIVEIMDSGCDVFVAGSSIFSNDNISAAAAELKNLITPDKRQGN